MRSCGYFHPARVLTFIFYYVTGLTGTWEVLMLAVFCILKCHHSKTLQLASSDSQRIKFPRATCGVLRRCSRPSSSQRTHLFAGGRKPAVLFPPRCLHLIKHTPLGVNTVASVSRAESQQTVAETSLQSPIMLLIVIKSCTLAHLSQPGPEPGPPPESVRVHLSLQWPCSDR